MACGIFMCKEYVLWAYVAAMLFTCNEMNTV